MLRTLIITLILSVVSAGPIFSQSTNVEILGSLAVKCLGEIPGAVDTFRVRPGKRMPFLRPYLTRHWLSHGYTVYVGDSTTTADRFPIHVLSYDPESANVSYERAERDSLVRTIDLTIAHSFVSPEGKLIEESRCQNTSKDMIFVKDVTRVQQDPWEESQGTIPLDRGWRVWAEPAVIGTSIAVLVYLFFSVRS